jgi:hypothetical protein
MDDQIKKNEMGITCSKPGRQSKCIKSFEGKVKEKDHLKALGLKWILEK